MANEQNLIPQKKGEPAPPNAGRPKGSFGLRRILAEIAEDPDIDLLNLKPKDKEELKKRYGTNVKKAIAYGIITRMITNPNFASSNIEKIEGILVDSGDDKLTPDQITELAADFAKWRQQRKSKT